MAIIDSTTFGSITIDGRRYGDVLIINGLVIPRDKERVRALYGTSHALRQEEARELLKGEPQVIVVGNGQYGALKVDEEAAQVIRESAELIVAQTPQAIKRFNELSRSRRVNALIHVTC